jgi:8-oxo-dGTP diphosphatase
MRTYVWYIKYANKCSYNYSKKERAEELFKIMGNLRLVSVVHVFLIKDNQILLLRRFNTGHEDGNYGVPAGRLEGGEEVKSAAIREVKEECNIEINPDDLEIIGVMHINSNDERVDFFFVTDCWSGEIRNSEPHKCDDLSWFSIDNLPSNFIPFVKQALDNYKNRIWFSSHGWN